MNEISKLITVLALKNPTKVKPANLRKKPTTKTAPMPAIPSGKGKVAPKTKTVVQKQPKTPAKINKSNNARFWNNLTPAQQQAYKAAHPNSKKQVGGGRRTKTIKPKAPRIGPKTANKSTNINTNPPAATPPPVAPKPKTQPPKNKQVTPKTKPVAPPVSVTNRRPGRGGSKKATITVKKPTTAPMNNTAPIPPAPAPVAPAGKKYKPSNNWLKTGQPPHKPPAPAPTPKPAAPNAQPGGKTKPANNPPPAANPAKTNQNKTKVNKTNKPTKTPAPPKANKKAVKQTFKHMASVSNNKVIQNIHKSLTAKQHQTLHNAAQDAKTKDIKEMGKKPLRSLGRIAALTLVGAAGFAVAGPAGAFIAAHTLAHVSNKSNLALGHFAFHALKGTKLNEIGAEKTGDKHQQYTDKIISAMHDRLKHLHDNPNPTPAEKSERKHIEALIEKMHDAKEQYERIHGNDPITPTKSVTKVAHKSKKHP